MNEIEVFGRFSIMKDEPGWVTYLQQGGSEVDWRITLDGQDVPRVVTANTYLGEILVHALDDKECVIVSGGEIVQETIHGKVKVFITRRNK